MHVEEDDDKGKEKRRGMAGGLGLKEEVAGSGQRWRKEDGQEREAAHGVGGGFLLKLFLFSFQNCFTN